MHCCTRLSFKPRLCHTGAMARLHEFNSQVILCPLENCSLSMWDMLPQLSLKWGITGFQLPGLHSSSGGSALLWQSISCPSLWVIFQSAICFRWEVCGVHKATDEPNLSLGFDQGLFQQMTARTPTDIIKSMHKRGNNCFEHAQAALLRSSYLKMWPLNDCIFVSVSSKTRMDTWVASCWVPFVFQQMELCISITISDLSCKGLFAQDRRRKGYTVLPQSCAFLYGPNGLMKVIWGRETGLIPPQPAVEGISSCRMLLLSLKKSGYLKRAEQVCIMSTIHILDLKRKLQ